jgi:ABC-type amino acid transport substrate-binding protein
MFRTTRVPLALAALAALLTAGCGKGSPPGKGPAASSLPPAPGELGVAGRPFSQEPYGIGVPRGDNALRFALDDALEAREKNGDWKKAYEATLGLSGVPAPRPPAIDCYPAN